MTSRHVSRKLVVAAIGLLLTGATVALAPAAAAAGTCGYNNTLCLWEEERFGGGGLTASPLGSGGVCVDLVQHGWGERARSVINTSRRTASLFASADCTGRPYPVDGNTSVPTLSFLANSVYVAK